MYNDSYYSRRGRTIQRKKIDNGHVINPSLVPVYYNYLRDNGMFPSAPPPPVHVDDGKCIAVDYDNQEYSFPSSATFLGNALGTLLDTLGIDVDITKVDHIFLQISVTHDSGQGNPVLYFTTHIQSGTQMLGTYTNEGTHSYSLTFYRNYDVAISDFSAFYCSITRSLDGNSLNSIITYIWPNRIQQVSGGHVYLNRIVVSALAE